MEEKQELTCFVFRSRARNALRLAHLIARSVCKQVDRKLAAAGKSRSGALAAGKTARWKLRLENESGQNAKRR